jgi:cytochrome P450
MADDIYAGYHIPAGSIVIPNVWSMLHSPETYAKPLSFDPNRFMGDTPERDPREIGFGFGRRICPGMHLADASVWLSCALALATLRVRPVEDAQGREVLPEPVMMSGAISHPKPFRCEITPRSERARVLVLATAYADELDA